MAFAGSDIQYLPSGQDVCVTHAEYSSTGLTSLTRRGLSQQGDFPNEICAAKLLLQNITDVRCQQSFHVISGRAGYPNALQSVKGLFPLEKAQNFHRVELNWNHSR